MWVVSCPAVLLQEGDRLVSKVSDMGLALRLPVAAMQVDAAASKLWYVPGELPVATARGRFVRRIHLLCACVSGQTRLLALSLAEPLSLNDFTIFIPPP
jgi:hypothetical protein